MTLILPGGDRPAARSRTPSRPNIARTRDASSDMQTFGHVDYDEDEGLDHEAAERIAWECDYARKIVMQLNFYYPGHAWEVTVDRRQGGAQIRIAVLMTGTQCWFMRFSDIDTANDFKRRVMQAGGELLERFRIPRNSFDLTAFVEAKPKAVFHHNQRMPE